MLIVVDGTKASQAVPVPVPGPVGVLDAAQGALRRLLHRELMLGSPGSP